jgi:hypothetical protein
MEASSDSVAVSFNRRCNVSGDVGPFVQRCYFCTHSC